MQQNEARALCVSIHDVSPHTWRECRLLIDTVRSVAEIPLTLLVVPAYHRLHASEPAAYLNQLEQHLAQGDELALHGYTHLDEAAAPSSIRDLLRRRLYTTSEGEFSALSTAEASRRLELGLEWFHQHGWPVSGFVAPAYLLSAGAWKALPQYPLKYTTTMRHFYFLPACTALASRSLVYGARNAATRKLSSLGNDTLARAMSRAPLVRLGLHPADARHPALLSHLVRLLGKVIPGRTAMTKQSFVLQHRHAAIGQDDTGASLAKCPSPHIQLAGE